MSEADKMLLELGYKKKIVTYESDKITKERYVSETCGRIEEINFYIPTKTIEVLKFERQLNICKNYKQ